MAYHRPVLLNESIEGLNIRPKGIYADLTFGGGGHSREILNRLGKQGKLLAFDQDADAAGNLPEDSRLTFVNANFRYLRQFLKYHNISQLDGVLADLGVSSHQFDQPTRGFSFRSDQVLDMRMDRRSEFTAAEVLNTYSQEDLAKVFSLYGELKQAWKISAAIVQARQQEKVNTASDLENALGKLVPANQPSKFMARLYQALRIEVNREMEALEELLEHTAEVMAQGGRLVIITYHSLEDRLVKNYMKSGNTDGRQEKDFYGNIHTPWQIINRNVIVPGDAEVRLNNRARSAKLRIAEKI